MVRMPRQEGQHFPFLSVIGIKRRVPCEGGHPPSLLRRKELWRISPTMRGRLQDERGFRRKFPGFPPVSEVARMTRFYLAALLSLGTQGPALLGAGFLPPVFKSKPPEESKVSVLIETLRKDPDEAKRAGAANELRSVDASSHPEALEALIEAAKNDKKPGVRAEAVNSLSRVRGGHELAGPVLEEALANDGSMRVRLQARSGLMGLYLSGYRPAAGKAANPKPEDGQGTAGSLEKLAEGPTRQEAISQALPDKVTPRTATGKETSGSERFGFRVIPSWVNRKEIASPPTGPQNGDSKWWTPRVPMLPGILGKPTKELKEPENKNEPRTAQKESQPGDLP